jgi:hypothetical protein
MNERTLMHGCCLIGVLNCDYRSSPNLPPLATKVDWSEVAVDRMGFLRILEVPGSKPASRFSLLDISFAISKGFSK